jgi:hypothetical protein
MLSVSWTLWNLSCPGEVKQHSLLLYGSCVQSVCHCEPKKYQNHLPSPFARLQALSAECVSWITEQTGYHSLCSLLPLTVNSKSEWKVDSLPPLGLEPATFGTHTHLSGRSAKSLPKASGKLWHLGLFCVLLLLLLHSPCTQEEMRMWPLSISYRLGGHIPSSRKVHAWYNVFL